MAKFEQIIHKFNGGMYEDARQGPAFRQILNFYSYGSRFDGITYPYRLVPQFAQQDGLQGFGISTSNDIRNFVFAQNGFLYLLGIDGSSNTNIFKTSYSSASLSTPSNGTGGSSGTLRYSTFFEYHGNIYGFRGTRLFQFDTGGFNAFVDNFLDVSSLTFCAQGIVHPADDIAYIPYDNKIALIKPVTGTDTGFANVISISEDYTITSVVPSGNYLAIFGRPSNATSPLPSRMWLWDRDTSLATFTDNISLGEGMVFAAGNVNDTILIASFVYRPTTGNLIKTMSYSGGLQDIKSIKTNTLTNITQINAGAIPHQVFNNRLYFAVDDTTVAQAYGGIWSIGRTNVNESLAITIEKTAGTGTNVVNQHQGFIFIGDTLWTSYFAGGTTGNLSYSNGLGYGSTVSAYESQIFAEGDSSLAKRILGVAMGYQALPSGAAITFQASVDGGAFKTIFTDSTLGSTYHEALLNESDQSAIASSYKEIKFRIESTGGAVPTSFKYKGETLGTLIE